jgi:exodeoxyribonuclease-1
VGDLQGALGLPTAEVARQAAVVSADGQFAARVGVAMQQRYPPFEPSQAVEQRMYEGFPSRADESRMQAFHAAGWGERAAIAETIEDDRYRELARRIVFLEQPDALQPERRQMLGVWLQNCRLGREGVEAGRTIGDAMIDLEGIVVDDTDASALQEIRRWLEGMGLSEP